MQKLIYKKLRKKKKKDREKEEKEKQNRASVLFISLVMSFKTIQN